MTSGKKGTRKENPFGSTDLLHLPTEFPRLRAIGYARVSSLVQVDLDNPLGADADEISLPEQIDAVKRYCRDKGYEYVGTYWDVKTGATSDRQGLLQLCAAARQDDFDMVIVWRTNRLCRGASGAAPLGKAWEETHKKLRVESITDTLTMNLLPVLAWAAGQARDDIRAHTAENRLARARRGEAVSANYPFWLRRDSETKRAVLVPENAEVMLGVIQRYLDRVPVTEIATWLRRRGVHHPTRPFCDWNPRTIQNSLWTSTLHGEYWYSRRYSEPATDRATGVEYTATKDKRKLSPIKYPELVKQPTIIRVPALIHRDEAERRGCEVADCQACEQVFMFADIEAERARRRKVDRGRKPDQAPWWLKGMLFCGGCGSALSSTVQKYVYHPLTGGGYKRYDLRKPIRLLRCQRQQITNMLTDESGRRRKCRPDGHNYLRADGIEAAVRAALIEVWREPDRFINAANEFLRDQEARQDEAPDHAAVERLTREVGKLTRDLAALWQSRQDGQVDEEVYQTLNVQLREKKAAAQADLNAALQANERREHKRQTVCDGRVFVQRMRFQVDRLEGASETQWRALAANLLERVDVMTDGRVEYTWAVPGVEIEAGRVLSSKNGTSATTRSELTSILLIRADGRSFVSATHKSIRFTKAG